MKNLTKKSFLNKVNEKCNFNNEVIFISCLKLKNQWWTAIVRKYVYYIVYKSTLDGINEIYRVNFVQETNAIDKALEKAKQQYFE